MPNMSMIHEVQERDTRVNEVAVEQKTRVNMKKEEDRTEEEKLENEVDNEMVDESVKVEE